MFGLKQIGSFVRRSASGQINSECAVDQLATQLAAESVAREGWVDSGIWSASVYRQAARAAIVRAVAVGGDEAA